MSARRSGGTASPPTQTPRRASTRPRPAPAPRFDASARGRSAAGSPRRGRRQRLRVQHRAQRHQREVAPARSGVNSSSREMSNEVGASAATGRRAAKPKPATAARVWARCRAPPDRLGRAGGPRGVDHVGQVARGGRPGRNRLRPILPILHQKDRAVRGEGLRQLRPGHQDMRRRVLQEIGQARRRERGIERHVDAARLPDAQRWPRAVGRAVEAEGHARIGPDAQTAQPAA